MLNRHQLNIVQKSRFCISGAAKSGIAVAKLLSKHTKNIFVTDSAVVSRETLAMFEDIRIPFFTAEQGLPPFDCLVTSPAILLSKEPNLSAIRQGISVVSEIEVASWFTDRTIVGITGSNGKSTTTHYLAQLLNEFGVSAVACGNYGTPLSEAVIENNSECLITELSSYQLETTHNLECAASVFLNLQADHMARYETMDAYFKAKWRLVLQTQANGIVVLGSDVYDFAIATGVKMPQCEICVLDKQFANSNKNSFLHSLYSTTPQLPLSLYKELKTVPKTELESGLSFANMTAEGHVHARFLKTSWDFKISEPCIPGQHNAQNILAASILAFKLGVTLENIQKFWQKPTSTYQHIQHRLEQVAKGTLISNPSKSVTFVNDSKATNIQSTLVALNAYPGQHIILLLGGEPKGDSYAELLPYLKYGAIQIVPFGPAAPKIISDLKNHKMVMSPHEKLIPACESALSLSKNNSLILLSPGCASFDEFANFEHRGSIFKEWACLKVTV